MTLTAGLDTALAAPVESQASNPVASDLPNSLTLSREESELAFVALRGSNPSFRGREVVDPKQRQLVEYLKAREAGRIAQARALVDTRPDSPIAWARLAQVLMGEGDVSGAVEAAHRVVTLRTMAHGEQLGSASDMALFIAARVLATGGEGDEAEEILEGMQGDGPWAWLYAALAERRGDYALALERLREVKTADGAALRGYLLLKLNRPQLSLSELRVAQRAGSVSPSLLMNFAYAYANLGSLPKAIRSARHAVALAPTSASASFNLASYLRAANRAEEALEELRRQASAIGYTSSQIASATADALVALGRPRDALRELRRAQHHSDRSTEPRRTAELMANTALLEWKFGDRDRESLVEILQNQIALIGPYLPLSLMLADVASTTRVHDQLVAHFNFLKNSVSADELLSLMTRILILEGDIAGAANCAVEYANANPLDSDAVRFAVILSGQGTGNYSAAADLGLEGHRRTPNDLMLLNNTAFCLALAGRVDEANRLLEGQELENVFLVATRGLVDLAAGKVEQGLARYDEAASRLGSEISDPEEVSQFERLLRAQEAVVIHQLGLDEHLLVRDRSVVSVPEDWASDPRYLILRRAAEMVDAPWPKLNDRGTSSA